LFDDLDERRAVGGFDFDSIEREFSHGSVSLA
jgi:hypothetical protein